MLDRTVAFRLGAQWLVVSAAGTNPRSTGARRLSVSELRWSLRQVGDVHLLRRLIAIADISRPSSPMAVSATFRVDDRLAMLRIVDALVAQGRLHADARSSLRGGAQAQEYVPNQAAEPEEQEVVNEELGWIEIELKDEDGDPVPKAKYELTLPDGTKKTGRLNAEGFARVNNIPDGECQVCFPDYDYSSWAAAAS